MGRRRVTSARQPPRFLLTLSIVPPPFPEAFKLYGMATVLPYIGAVKGLSLHIVSQAINAWDAGRGRRFPTGEGAFSLCPVKLWMWGPVDGLVRLRRCPLEGYRGAKTSEDDVDIFKNFAGCNAARSIARFHQIVALLALMFPAERIHEDEWPGELAGSDQKSGAINLPRAGRLGHVLPP